MNAPVGNPRAARRVASVASARGEAEAGVVANAVVGRQPAREDIGVRRQRDHVVGARVAEPDAAGGQAVEPGRRGAEELPYAPSASARSVSMVIEEDVPGLGAGATSRRGNATDHGGGHARQRARPAARRAGRSRPARARSIPVVFRGLMIRPEQLTIGQSWLDNSAFRLYLSNVFHRIGVRRIRCVRLVAVALRLPSCSSRPRLAIRPAHHRQHPRHRSRRDASRPAWRHRHRHERRHRPGALGRHERIRRVLSCRPADRPLQGRGRAPQFQEGLADERGARASRTNSPSTSTSRPATSRTRSTSSRRRRRSECSAATSRASSRASRCGSCR